jgi:hypothetical protein
MSTSSNHNNSSFDKIETYVSGDMTSSEKNTFEKEMADDSFLQDAVDGFSSTPNSVQYFNSNLKKKSNSKYYIIGITLVSALLLTGVFWNLNELQPKPLQLVEKHLPQTNQEIEILPLEIESLHVISKQEEITSIILAKKNENRPIESVETTQPDTDLKKDFTLEIVELSISDDDEIEDEIIQTITKVKTNYPFTYYYDLAVVDYRRYENREKSIAKTTYVFSGVGANYEDESAQNQSQFTEKIVKVTYMDYLEESMWYFSKAKYKNALKRFDVIAGQYKNDLNALFYGGLSNYNLGRFEFALNNFESITRLEDTPFYEEALWYKAKTKLKLGQTKAARSDLELIISEAGFYAKQAMKLMKTL